MHTLLLATKNKNKVFEFTELLKPLGIEVLCATDFPELPDVEEDGETFEENALKKARTLSIITGKPTLADDSGLLVDALNGAPGVYSARYAGEKASYAENVNKLIAELSSLGEFPYSAHFKTVLCLVDGEQVNYFSGECHGEILSERKGEKGFGYDPVFIPNGFEQTFAEMSKEEKNAISHRAKATQLFLDYLKK
ncbi:RdgB/HAM1 family non-canonical purine NTP pyrophosphatase [bacterium]|nr:MAG: RdgB/HAM1 family non-canonical purine NTP pyrophosphatase [bacterium]